MNKFSVFEKGAASTKKSWFKKKCLIFEEMISLMKVLDFKKISKIRKTSIFYKKIFNFWKKCSMFKKKLI